MTEDDAPDECEDNECGEETNGPEDAGAAAVGQEEVSWDLEFDDYNCDAETLNHGTEDFGGVTYYEGAEIVTAD